MPCHLLVLHCPDSEDWAAEIRHFYSPLMVTSVTNLDSIGFPLRPSIVQSLAKCKKAMLLMSPLFLEVLDARPHDLFKLTNYLNPASTIAVFCCGALPRDINSCRKAGLSSCEQWSIVKLDDGQDFCKFAQCTISPLISGQRYSDEEPTLEVTKKKAQKVLLVPQRACCQKENSFFLIFEEAIDLKVVDLTVTLHKEEIAQPEVQLVNPFVAQFSVPDCFLSTPGNIRVLIEVGLEGSFEKLLECESYDGLCDCDKGDGLCDDNEVDGLCDSEKDDGRSDDPLDSPVEILDSDGENQITEDLRDQITDQAEVLPLNRMDSVTRTRSLPSLLSPQEPPFGCGNPLYMDVITDDSCYMDMTCSKRQAVRPHERFLQSMFERHQSVKYEQIENFLVSHLYDSKTQVAEDVPQKNGRSSLKERSLSKSQQELVELLQAFKRGVKTISEVEHLFQGWHQRHRDSLRVKEAGPIKQKCKKIQRGQSFGFKNILSNTKRKVSRTKVTYFQGINAKSERRTKSLSKISNSSNSSGCSLSSEISSSGKHTDSGNSCSSQRKLIPNAHLPPTDKHDDPSTTWFRTLSNQLNRNISSDEAPPCLMPSRPPPKIAKPPRKPKPLPPPPSPDYIIPNHPYEVQTRFATNLNVSNKLLDGVRTARKFSAPNIQCHRKMRSRFVDDTTTNHIDDYPSELKLSKSLSDLCDLPIYLEIVN